MKMRNEIYGKSQFRKENYQNVCEGSKKFLPPFAKFVTSLCFTGEERIFYKSRVFFLFLVFEILEHLPYLYFSGKVTVPR